MGREFARCIAALVLLIAGCQRDPTPEPEKADEPPPWDVGNTTPAPVPGMVWIPPGVLIAGTPPNRLPRVADEEMAGEQVVMTGFYIDKYAFPNEAGAIPTTNFSQSAASASCAEIGKRLCTELEWERACKGPDNLTYDYGDRYQATSCMTGTQRNLVPNGVNASCKSAFGVHDLHGGVWNWTSSSWGRGTDGELVTIRGGNGSPGELVGRCANGRGKEPSLRHESIGFRCCQGEVNSFEVVLSVTRGEPLRWQPPDKRVAPRLEVLVPDSGLEEGPLTRALLDAPTNRKGDDQSFTVERMWVWQPLGNEELVIGGGCGQSGKRKQCGVLVARMRNDQPTPLAFVSSERWEPNLGQTDTARELFLYGGDVNGAFRKRIGYEWGRLSIGEKHRKKRRKGQKNATYD